MLLGQVHTKAVDTIEYKRVHNKATKGFEKMLKSKREANRCSRCGVDFVESIFLAQ
jgi:hypothetical protein